VRVSLACLVLLLLGAADAGAATVVVGIDPESEAGNTITYQAAAGEPNRLALTLSGSDYVFRDAGAPVASAYVQCLGPSPAAECATSAPPCTQVSANAVRCAAAFTFGGMVVLLDDMADTATMPRRYSSNTGDVEVGGGLGNDVLYSSALGGDLISGLEGNDRLYGRGGKDIVLGGLGKDTLDGGAGVDSFAAGPGRDLVRARDGRAELVGCGSGRDRAETDRSDHRNSCERR
jgi:Ca2+-binding RTX toxin-like protein